jgi:hypothetical protein
MLVAPLFQNAQVFLHQMAKGQKRRVAVDRHGASVRAGHVPGCDSETFGGQNAEDLIKKVAGRFQCLIGRIEDRLAPVAQQLRAIGHLRGIGVIHHQPVVRWTGARAGEGRLVLQRLGQRGVQDRRHYALS